MSNLRAIALAALLALALAVSGCQQPTVRVESGERIVCTYGEVVKNTVKVVDVPADQAAKYTIVETIVTCDRHKRLEALYSEAQTAIASGDLKAARAKLAQVTAIEPLFKQAGQQLAAIDAGKKPVADKATGTGGGNAGGGEGQTPIGPIANLAGWVPDKLSGFTSRPMLADSLQLSREYTPQGGAADYLMIVVEQYKTAAYARKAIAEKIQAAYPVAASTLTVKGRSIYFGTDGRRFGVAAWNEGPVVIAVEASASDLKPAGLKATLTAVAGQLIK
ncbi:MAG: hypothetical protein Q7W30_08490 [Coriobacteriia bacterium]|nr:hypothetical protein [Coriobacteriia bacterium]